MITGRIFFHCDKANRNLRGFSSGVAAIDVRDGKEVSQDFGQVTLSVGLSYQIHGSGTIVHATLNLDRPAATTLMTEICRFVTRDMPGPT